MGAAPDRDRDLDRDIDRDIDRERDLNARARDLWT